MIAHTRKAIELAQQHFPWAQLVLRFDHSSNHTAMAEDALVALRMNVSDGGGQPVLRDTEFKNSEGVMITQRMVNASGEAKGLETVLRDS